MYKEAKIEDMRGLVMALVTGAKGEDQMFFHARDGRTFRFFHSQDCCESVDIEDVAGDLADLVGEPLLVAEESSNEGAPAVEGDSYRWTFYKFATIKGSVTVRWLGLSNGYYSESVDLEVVGSPC